MVSNREAWGYVRLGHLGGRFGAQTRVALIHLIAHISLQLNSARKRIEPESLVFQLLLDNLIRITRLQHVDERGGVRVAEIVAGLGRE